ncbi:hypothetical protein GR183_07630 [Stappia sp. GBMRC 2046]|uniref:DUF1097 domain-containing protein n=1 Tax=Stappia sediminis TaxID=2692190 RepID=A0A7X3LTF0_9HYPH|nr:hypothetical protein [Stappia sediminis]MXN64773.1 hypothetical protein [Stappia sediminis]
MNVHITGIALGIAIGLVDCSLFAATGMPITAPLAVEAVVFWAAVGWAIHTVPVKLPGIVKGVAISWFLNIPWILEYAVVQGQAEIFMPMAVLGTLFGAVAGLVSAYLKRRSGAAAAGRTA